MPSRRNPGPQAAPPAPARAAECRRLRPARKKASTPSRCRSRTGPSRLESFAWPARGFRVGQRAIAVGCFKHLRGYVAQAMTPIRTRLPPSSLTPRTRLPAGSPLNCCALFIGARSAEVFGDYRVGSSVELARTDGRYRRGAMCRRPPFVVATVTLTKLSVPRKAEGFLKRARSDFQEGSQEAPQAAQRPSNVTRSLLMLKPCCSASALIVRAGIA